MSDFKKIAEMMRADWDRRIAHDYRFWMSDGRASDEVMWETGERDFDILTQGICNCREKSLLEIGCGVGRLLHTARQRFERVIGLDVSKEAIEKAGELLSTGPQVELITGSGFDLAGVPDDSQDVVLSFAALTSMPTDIIASYLSEMRRTVKPSGCVRLQVYLGDEQPVRKTDTLHLRCYTRENFIKAAEAAGFKIEWMKELKLPFEVSFKELGIEAIIVSLLPEEREPASLDQISAALLPGGEVEQTEVVNGDDLEYWMSVNYAKELAKSGDLGKAQETLEYAAQFSRDASIDVQDILVRIVKGIAESTDTQLDKPRAAISSLNALSEKFPSVHSLMKDLSPQHHSVTIKDTAEGAALYYEGHCLDHGTKPLSGAEAWGKRALLEERIRDAAHLVVFGFGLGYHIEWLLENTDKQITVVEPHKEVLRAALEQRDLSPMFKKLSGLAVGADVSPQMFGVDTELLVRPQSQAVAHDLHRKVRATCYGTRGMAKLKPQIGVVGPLQGGTLPIMSYTSHALAYEQQRGREIDLSGFATGYHSVQSLLSNDILKAKATGSYVEMLSSLVLDSVTERPVDILICMAQAPLSGNVLTELRKRGIITVLWFVEDYMRFTTWQSLAPFYDFIFTIQKGDCIKAIEQAGCNEVHYLPTGFDPLVHQPLTLNSEEQARWGSSVSFVGAGYHNRQQSFASLAGLDFKIWGTEWPHCKPFDRLVQEEGRRLKPEEYVKIFNGTKININLHSSTERDGVDPYGDFLNPRTFELAGCGAFQLVDSRSLLGDVFTPGKDIVTFDTTTELKDKIQYYLEHEDERRQIAQAGRETVLKHHTYQHRLREMLSVIYSSKFEHLKRRQDKSPWKRILERAKPFPELHERCERAFGRGEEPGLDALVADIVTGEGALSDTEQKLLFLFHVSKQIIKMRREGIEEKKVCPKP